VALQAEELARRLTEWVERKCALILQSEAVQQSLAERLEAERAKMEAEVDAELAAEKALADEEQRRAREEIDAKRLELERLQADRKREVRHSSLPCHLLVCSLRS
jgi:arginine/glutamate-rich protein 1